MEKVFDKTHWATEVFPLLKKCNSSNGHRMIDMTPNCAANKVSEAKMNIKMNAMFTRKYPEKTVGNHVRYLKNRDAVFSRGVKALQRIGDAGSGQKVHALAWGKRRFYLTHELLKV